MLGREHMRLAVCFPERTARSLWLLGGGCARSAPSECSLPDPHFRPGAITVGPDGNLRFKEPGKIGRITLTGTISEFPLPTPGGPGGITVGPDGALWFTEMLSNKIGHLV